MEYKIKPLSQLSVEEFMLIVDKTRYLDLVSYISAFVGFDIDKSKVEMKDIELGKRFLLDEDVDFTKIEVPLLFRWESEDLVVKEIDDGTFGIRHIFNIYRNHYEADQIGIIELCVYCLAICLSRKEEYADIEDNYNQLVKMNWMKILPIGFFLSKRLSPKRNYLMTFLMISIIKLRFIMKTRVKVMPILMI